MTTKIKWHDNAITKIKLAKLFGQFLAYANGKLDLCEKAPEKPNAVQSEKTIPTYLFNMD